MTLRVRFVCSRNDCAAHGVGCFAGMPGVEADSAGLATDVEVMFDAPQVHCADLIVVMERRHKARLARQCGARLKDRRVVCADIPDRYDCTQPELVALPQRKVGPLLQS